MGLSLAPRSAHYRGKELLRRLHDEVVEAVKGFGEDVEIAPKKSSVSLRRSKEFALTKSATKTHLDIGIKAQGR